MARTVAGSGRHSASDDRHVVRAGEKAVYEGESIYYVNHAAGQLEYFYVTRSGGHTHGRVAPEADSIAFPPAKLIGADGKAMGFRSRFTRAGDDAYDVLREYETEKGWVPVRMRMTKVPKG